jgi:aryl-alcohol dehydrogenase-like predicted oxidoreductase
MAWVLPEDESRPFIKRLEMGINFSIPPCIPRGVSEITGRLEGISAMDVVVATSVLPRRKSGDRTLGKHIFDAVDRSSATRHDMWTYQIHRWDFDTPIEETMGALNDVVLSAHWRIVHGGVAVSKARRRKTAGRFVSIRITTIVYREEEREMVPLCAIWAWALFRGRRLRGFLGQSPQRFRRLVRNRPVRARHALGADFDGRT